MHDPHVQRRFAGREGGEKGARVYVVSPEGGKCDDAPQAEILNYKSLSRYADLEEATTYEEFVVLLSRFAAIIIAEEKGVGKKKEKGQKNGGGG